MKMAENSPKRVENTVGTGEIARYEQFLLFPLCFQKTSTADTLKPGLVWEGLSPAYQPKSCKALDLATPWGISSRN